MFMRVCLRHVGEGGDRCRFDLSLGPNLHPLTDKVHFGFWGALDGVHESFGVLLKPDGVIDLGSGWELPDRLHKTNLHDRRMELGQYVTIWWTWGDTQEENTYIVEAVLQLSGLTDLVTVPIAASFLTPDLVQLPRFRARVNKSFDISGYDDVIYRPPVGVEGDVANFHGDYIFCPDNAISKNGEQITVFVNAGHLEMIVDSGAL